MKTHTARKMPQCIDCMFGMDGHCTAAGGMFNGLTRTDKHGDVMMCSNKVGFPRAKAKRIRVVKGICDMDILDSYKSLRHV